MNRNCLWSLVLATLAVLSSTTIANAQARFINLSDQDVFIASYAYQPYSSNSGGLQVITDEGWNFSGWWKVEPGAAWEGAAGHYYVKNNRKSLTWDGRKTSRGFVKAGKFNAFVPKAGLNQKEKELLRGGYERVNYQELGDGIWTISGDAYLLKEKSFDFNFSSRSIEFHNRDFEVPGRVAYLTLSGEEWGAKGISWRYGTKKAWVTLSTRGEQKRPFGPREPGYYQGKVTVHYTERR